MKAATITVGDEDGRKRWGFVQRAAFSTFSTFFRLIPHVGISGARICEKSTPSALQGIFAGSRVKRTTIAGVPCRIVQPKGEKEGRGLVLYIHGGAYTFGSWATHAYTALRLADETGATLWFPEYSLAPENPLPTAHKELLELYRVAISQQGRAKACVICGDSAGGALALNLAREIGVAELEAPAGVVALSPLVDPFREGGSIEENRGRDVLNPTMMRYCHERACAPEMREEPSFKLIDADFSGVAPVLLLSVEGECLRDQVRDFAEKLAAVDVLDRHLELADGFHTIQDHAAIFPEVEPLWEAWVSFIKSRLETGTKGGGEEGASAASPRTDSEKIE